MVQIYKNTMGYHFEDGICATTTASGKDAQIRQTHNAINNREYYTLRINMPGWKTVVTRGTLIRIAQVVAQS